MNVSFNNGFRPSEIIEDSVTITAIPAAVMLLGSVITLYWPQPPPKMVAHAIQHFAAGILLSAIALDLIPPIASAKQMISILGMAIGFSLGTILMISLPLLFGEHEEEVASAVEMSVQPAGNGDKKSIANDSDDSDALLQLRHSIRASAFCGHPAEQIEGVPLATEPILVDESQQAAANVPHIAEGEEDQEDPLTADSHAQQFSPYSIYSCAQRILTRRRNSLQQLFGRCPVQDDACKELASISSIQCETKPKFPFTFAVAVYVDCVIDGLLVGVSLITGTSAGLFMAVAMALEMGFLGLSFAAAVRTQAKWVSIPAVMSAPILMLIGAAIGGLVANVFATNEPFLIGCISFGVAALLYMVTEELLVSAHEDGFGHCWWVDIQVFVGFLLATVVGLTMQRVS